MAAWATELVVVVSQDSFVSLGFPVGRRSEQIVKTPEKLNL